MVSGDPKSTGISWVDGLSTGPPDLGRHRKCLLKRHFHNFENFQFTLKVSFEETPLHYFVENVF